MIPTPAPRASSGRAESGQDPNTSTTLAGPDPRDESCSELRLLESDASDLLLVVRARRRPLPPAADGMSTGFDLPPESSDNFRLSKLTSSIRLSNLPAEAWAGATPPEMGNGAGRAGPSSLASTR